MEKTHIETASRKAVIPTHTSELCPMVVPNTIPYTTPYKKFRLQLK